MMKKYITCLLLALSSYTYSQENKHKFIANINARFHYTNSPVNLGNLNLGYFVTNRLALGIFGSSNNYKNTSNSIANPMSSQNIISRNYAGLFARYNYLPGNSKFGFVANLNSGYTFEKSTTEQTVNINGIEHIETYETKGRGYSISLNSGILYAINKRFSVEVILATFSYSQNLNKNEYSQEKRSLLETRVITSGFDIGFSYYFGCKRSEKIKTDQ